MTTHTPLLLACSFFLAACGFQPFYPQYNALNIPSLYITPMPEHNGQFLHTELAYQLSSYTPLENISEYTLQITLTSSSSLVSDDIYNDTGKWWQIETIAHVFLLDNHVYADSPETHNKKPVFQKKFLERGGIAAGHSPSARFAGKNQAEKQVLSQLARSIHDEISFQLLSLSKKS